MTASEIDQRFAAIDRRVAELDEQLGLVRRLLTRNEATAAVDPFAQSIRDSLRGGK
jgi:hypothetical protein